MTNLIAFKVAETQDIDAVLKLHARYQVDSISEDDKKDGFITTAFTHAQMQRLIEEEQGLFLALKDEQIIGYAMAASWEFWSIWPMFAHMIKDLPNVSYSGIQLSTDNSYQYGPVCVDKTYRGQGIFEQLFEYSLQKMSTRYPVLVTFINKINPRSYAAHVNKARLDVIKEFTFNNNHYYELACLTKR